MCLASAKPAKSLRQSSFQAKIFSAQSLSGHSSDFVPAETPALEVDRACLAMIDGGRSLGGIADELFALYPERFATAAAALNHVARLTAAYR